MNDSFSPFLSWDLLATVMNTKCQNTPKQSRTHDARCWNIRTLGGKARERNASFPKVGERLVKFFVAVIKSDIMQKHVINGLVNGKDGKRRRKQGKKYFSRH